MGGCGAAGLTAGHPEGDGQPGPGHQGQSCPHALFPDGLLVRVLSRVSASTWGYSHALVCRRWAALAPVAQARVRVCPRLAACGWDARHSAVPPGELARSLQPLPNVAALHLDDDAIRMPSKLSVRVELLLRLLRACPRLRVLSLPRVDLGAPSAADIFACAPNLTRLALRSRDPEKGSPSNLEDLDLFRPPGHGSAAGGGGRGNPAPGEQAPHTGEESRCREQAGVGEGAESRAPLQALQQLTVLRADVTGLPAGEIAALRSLPLLRSLSLGLKRSERGATLLISSSSLQDLSVKVPYNVDLHLGDLPALRALSLDLFRWGEQVPWLGALTALRALSLAMDEPEMDWPEVGLSCLTQLSSLRLKGIGGQGGTRRGRRSDAFEWVGDLRALRNLDWALDFETLPGSFSQLTHLTSLFFTCKFAIGWDFRTLEELKNLRRLGMTVNLGTKEAAKQKAVMSAVARLVSLESLTIKNRGQWLDLSALSSLHMLTSCCVEGYGSSCLPSKGLTRLEHLVIKPYTSWRDAEELRNGSRGVGQWFNLVSRLWLNDLRFHTVTQVTRLELGFIGRELSSLQPLSSLQALQDLIVWECIGLFTVDESLGSLPKLWKLQLGHLGSIEELPPGFFSRPRFPSLTHLQVDLPLKAWPASLGDLPQLKILRMKLTLTVRMHPRGPAEVRRHPLQLKDLLMPPSLEVLELQDCDLTMGADAGADFPSPLPKLRRLILSKFKTISCLPQNLGSLSNLGHLHLSHLPALECFPASFSALYRLDVLGVDYCKSLQGIPPEVQSLPCFVNDPELLGRIEEQSKRSITSFDIPTLAVRRLAVL